MRAKFKGCIGKGGINYWRMLENFCYTQKLMHQLR